MSNEFSAAEAKRHFGDLLRRAEGGGAVTITRYGRPVAVLVSAEDAARIERIRAAPTGGLAALAGRFADGGDFASAIDDVARARAESRHPPTLGEP